MESDEEDTIEFEIEIVESSSSNSLTLTNSNNLEENQPIEEDPDKISDFKNQQATSHQDNSSLIFNDNQPELQEELKKQSDIIISTENLQLPTTNALNDNNLVVNQDDGFRQDVIDSTNEIEKQLKNDNDISLNNLIIQEECDTDNTRQDDKQSFMINDIESNCNVKAEQVDELNVEGKCLDKEKVENIMMEISKDDLPSLSKLDKVLAEHFELVDSIMKDKEDKNTETIIPIFVDIQQMANDTKAKDEDSKINCKQIKEEPPKVEELKPLRLENVKLLSENLTENATFEVAQLEILVVFEPLFTEEATKVDKKTETDSETGQQQLIELEISFEAQIEEISKSNEVDKVVEQSTTTDLIDHKVVNKLIQEPHKEEEEEDVEGDIKESNLESNLESNQIKDSIEQKQQITQINVIEIADVKESNLYDILGKDDAAAEVINTPTSVTSSQVEDDLEVEFDNEPPFESRSVVVKRNKDPRVEYELSEELGRGKFGRVYRCLETSSGRKLAAKFVHMRRKEDREDVEREVFIMSILQHRRLLQLYDAFDDLIKNEMCLITELVEGGELFERVVDNDFELTEKKAAIFMRQICEGVEYMQEKSIVHLDMKPENILCLSKSCNRIKLIDFGLARQLKPGEELKVMFGTPDFAAPEVLAYDLISLATDMWSVGVICYVLLSGLSPFMGDSDMDTMANVTRAEFDFNDEAFEPISDLAKDFISKLLVKEPGKRLKPEECLKHAWLAKGGRQLEASALNSRRQSMINEMIQQQRKSLTKLTISDAERASLEAVAEKAALALAATVNTPPVLSLDTRNLKKYVVRRKWHKTVHAIMALGRMGAKLKLKLSESSAGSNCSVKE